MKLYHGTNMTFDKIDLRKSKPNKDFGQGFYLSPEYDQALEIREPAYRYADARKQVEIYERADRAIFLRHRKSLGNT